MNDRRRPLMPVSRPSLRRPALAVLVALLALSPASAECDLETPVLAGFDFDPAAVDVSTGSSPVTCTMTVTDDLAGVAEATCSFAGPFFLQAHECTATTPASGSRTNGTFECTVTIPQYSNAGTWSADVRLIDAVGNERPYSSFELSGAGFPSQLSVSSVPSDITAPTLNAFALAPTVVDVGTGPATVTCDMTFVDSPSGVDEAICQLQSPDTFVLRSCSATVPSSGDRNSGTFSCDVEIPRYADAGTWLASVQSFDLVGNVGFVDSTTLDLQGFPSEVAVTSAPEDVVAPDVVGFDFTPKTVDVSVADGTVTCTVDVTDALSGALFVGCSFLSPSEVQEAACLSTEPVSGTPQNGTYRCEATVPRYSEGGTWSATVTVQDQVGNGNALLPEDLGPLGFPTDLAVACDGAVVEPELRWETTTTLAWDPVGDATRYNVYRGDLAALPGDYGSCRNASDPDPTDTTYEDPDVPQPSGAGFMYLVTATVGGVEQTLGRASDGTERTVASPCP